MAFEFKLPDLGEGITEGEIVKWRVKPGDVVEEHQVVAEVETDKAIVEVPSPRKGKIKSLAKDEGEVVNVDETLLTIIEEGEAPEEAEKEEPEKKKAEPEGEKKEPEKEAAKEVEPAAEKRESVSVVGEVPEKEEVLAAPKVRKVARELGVNLATVEGTGPGGAVLEKDVRAAAEGAPAEKKAEKPPAEKPKERKEGEDQWGPVERVPVKGIRRTIAKNLMASQKNTAFVTGMDEADVTELWDLRKKERQVAKEKGVHLTFLPFFIKAVRHALEEFPKLNGSVSEDGTEIILKKYFNIGVAIDTPEGLMVAVVRDADKKSILDLAGELQELGERARAREVTLEELKGNSFTISNYGSFAGTFATPIINPPDIAILGTGRITDKPWVVDGEIKIRKVLPISLTFDHRVVDGVESARFLHKVIRYLEDPDQIFIESV